MTAVQVVDQKLACCALNDARSRAYSRILLPINMLTAVIHYKLPFASVRSIYLLPCFVGTLVLLFVVFQVHPYCKLKVSRGKASPALLIFLNSESIKEPGNSLYLMARRCGKLEFSESLHLCCYKRVWSKK